MTRQFTAHIPAIKAYQPHDVICTMDEVGHWTMDVAGYGPDAALESDIIDKCRKATNWAAIRAEHFAMNGFSVGGDIADNTPSYKSDF